MKKITKREMFENIKAVLAEVEGTEEVSADAMVEFCDKEIALLEKKAASAKVAAEKRKAKNDVLTDYVKDALTDEYRVIADITDEVAAAVEADETADLEVTASKVTYRLTALVKDGFAEKTPVDVEGADGKKRKVQGYRVATAEAAED